MFFRFPPDARWNPVRNTIEFGIGVGEYEGIVRVARRVFQILLPKAPRLNDALKPTIFIGPGSNSSPSRRFGGGYSPTMEMSRSPVAIFANGKSKRGIRSSHC